MFSVTEILAYVVVVLAIQAIPGPAVLLTLARSTSGGARVGIATGAGIACGDIAHTVMAVLGLSAILMTSALAFTIVKYLGVAYLIYLGICAFRERSGDLRMPTAAAISPAKAFRQAILTEVLNPKTALFFLSFLPQFVHPERGGVTTQLLVLGLIFVGLSMAFTATLAVCASAIAGRLMQHASVARWRNRVIGSVYIGLGIHLALQERR